MLYFTYGSFMDINNLKKHTPSAEFVCRAMIPNWEVQFNYYSKNYGGGVTGIEPAINKLVRGAVYEIPPDEMEYLDTIEGIPQGNLDQYIFEPEDPNWEKSVPASIQSKHRRTTVSCYSWPGIHPEASMRHYSSQLEPLVKVLLEKGYENLSMEGDYFERALYRASLEAW